jgi:hypothetical protein
MYYLRIAVQMQPQEKRDRRYETEIGCGILVLLEKCGRGRAKEREKREAKNTREHGKTRQEEVV